jgi:Na+/H+ antiporter NhaD/arsenite permease-like protein
VAFINPQYIPARGAEHPPVHIKFLREIVLVIITVLSLFTTRRSIRRANNFSWEPINEVAILFIGIFATMTPALLYLGEHAAELGLTAPWQYYYSTGVLSSFLDNTPTAVAFHQVALGAAAGTGEGFMAGISESILSAISLGAVFFGAMTYIGNGPNFMVKAIAEQEGVKMPSFFGYMLKFSLIILLPVFIIVQLIFL